MTIKEIETRTGLPRASVRYYEDEGLIHPEREKNGYRNYSEEDCQQLLKIRLFRQLGCSLDEIQSLQQGDRNMALLLEERIRALKQEQTEQAHTLALCEKLYADRISWNTLNPGTYLSWTEEPAKPAEPEVPDIRFQIPWRRFLARCLDQTLVATMCTVLVGLIFRVDTTTFNIVTDLFLGLALLLVLEPFFLSRFGTTPGKALLGLRLTRSDGSYFSYKEALKRTAGVLLFGEALQISPVSIFPAIFAYRRCRQKREQIWALDDETWTDRTGTGPFWNARGSRLGATGYVGINILCVLLCVGSWILAGQPLHRGPLTPEEFAENYNHLLVFTEGEDAVVEEITANGLRPGMDDPSVIFIGLKPPELTIETTDGIVTAVSFCISPAPEDLIPILALPTDEPTLIAGALAGFGTHFIPDFTPWGAIIQELTEPIPGSRSWTEGGWTISCDFEEEGYDIQSDGMLYSMHEDGDCSFLYTFRMERG